MTIDIDIARRTILSAGKLPEITSKIPEMADENGSPSCNGSEKCDPNEPSDRLLAMLDHIEQRVESLRTQAVSLGREKQDLLEALHLLQNSKDLHHVSPGKQT